MNTKLRQDGRAILDEAIRAVLPDEAVRRALEGRRFPGRVILIAAGKAAWQMANAAWSCLGEVISGGVVITKYGHVKGEIGNLVCCEAGHPVPDDNSFAGTEKAIEAVRGLTEEDTVLFLLSGGGSALFEKPLIPGEELQDVTNQLLACGADIVEMNIIRKRLCANQMGFGAITPLGGERGTVCSALRAGPYPFCGPQRYPGGPAGHDCLWSCLSGPLHL